MIPKILNPPQRTNASYLAFHPFPSHTEVTSKSQSYWLHNLLLNFGSKHTFEPVRLPAAESASALPSWVFLWVSALSASS